MFPPPLRCIRRFFCPGLFFAGRGPASTAPVVFPPVGPDDLIGPLRGFSAEVFRRLRAATYFARGGSSSQSPLHSVSAWRRKLRSFPCSSFSRRTRFAGLRREQRGIGQNAPGGRLRMGTLVPIFALPPDPCYRGYPLKWAKHFRRAKSEWRSAISPGPLGPGCSKIAAGAVSQLRLALPSQRSRCESCAS